VNEEEQFGTRDTRAPAGNTRNNSVVKHLATLALRQQSFFTVHKAKCAIHKQNLTLALNKSFFALKCNIMKQLTVLTMAFLLVFASCKKTVDQIPGRDISYTQADFVNNEAILPRAAKAGERKSDLKVVIRKVNNAENKYRLVLKVDSVQLNSVVPTDNPTFQPITGQDNVVFAGLSVPNPTNPDVDQVIFTKEQMVFRQTNENGYFVYVSDPFETDVNFDYELVGIEYAIEIKNNGLPIVISDKAEYFILPGGKSIEQAPEVARVKPPKLTLLDGNKQIKLGLVVSNDPVGEITKVVIEGTLIGTDANQKPLEFQIKTDLVKTTSSSIGVSAWGNEGCLTYLDNTTTPPVWKCDDAFLSKFGSGVDLTGNIYLIYNGGGRSTSNLECRKQVCIFKK